MDYTTVARVKSEIHAEKTTDDALLALLVTAASRAMDRRCTGVPDAVDYFKLETITNERILGQVSSVTGEIICYPHKPYITAVNEFIFQANVTTTQYTVDPSRVEALGKRVTAYPLNLALDIPSQCRVTISYTGGLGATVTDLPADLVELATLLTARFYREVEGSLNDAIGVAELATVVYSKAWPARLLEQLTPYIRRNGWRFVA